MSFPCTKCGLCCQNLDKVPQLKEYDLGNGVCVNFDSELGCNIYEDRPIFCRVDEGYDLYKEYFLSKSDYYQANAQACNKLQAEQSLNTIYRVKL
jgi:uncharacterized protein